MYHKMETWKIQSHISREDGKAAHLFYLDFSSVSPAFCSRNTAVAASLNEAYADAAALFTATRPARSGYTTIRISDIFAPGSDEIFTGEEEEPIYFDFTHSDGILLALIRGRVDSILPKLFLSEARQAAVEFFKLPPPAKSADTLSVSISEAAISDSGYSVPVQFAAIDEFPSHEVTSPPPVDPTKKIDLANVTMGKISTKLNNDKEAPFYTAVEYYVPYSYTVTLDEGYAKKFTYQVSLLYNKYAYLNRYASCVDEDFTIIIDDTEHIAGAYNQKGDGWTAVYNFTTKKYSITINSFFEVKGFISGNLYVGVDNTRQIAEEKENNNLSAKKAVTTNVIYDINKKQNANGSFVLTEENACWLAAATNILCQAGYFKGSAQSLYDHLVKYYFAEHGVSRGGNLSIVLKDLFPKIMFGSRSFSTGRIDHIKDIIDRGQLVFIGIRHNQRQSSGHAVTLYDFQFDETGKATGVYISDSDDRSEGLKFYSLSEEYILSNYIANGYYIFWYQYISTSNSFSIDLKDISNKTKKILEAKKSISSGETQRLLAVAGEGNLTVANQGCASDISVRDKGVMSISSGGKGVDINVYQDGVLHVADRAILAGEINISGEVFTAGTVETSEARINFDLLWIDSTLGKTLVSNISSLKSASFTITVSQTQAEGTYVLAGNADAFSKAFTVWGHTLSGGDGTQENWAGFEDGELGTLSVGGTLTAGNAVYKLERINSQLLFTISYQTPVDTVAPTVPGSLTQKVISRKAVLSWKASTDAGGVAGYSLRYGLKSDWSDAEFITVDGNSLTLDALSNGKYYFQVCAYDAYGNPSEWSEAGSFTVNVPVLSVVSSGLTVYRNCYDTDNQYYFKWDISNTGGRDIDSFLTYIVISKDKVYDSGDTVVSVFRTEALKAGQTVADYAQGYIPEAYLDGEYYIGLVAEQETDQYGFSHVQWVDWDGSYIPSNSGQIFTDPTWNQTTPWNDLCPLPASGGTTRTLLGCVPTSAAQILYSLKSPKSLHLEESDRYSYNGINLDGSSSQLGFPDFEALNRLVADIKYDGTPEDMAALAFAVAVKLGAGFGVDATSAAVSKSFLLEDCGFDSATSWSVTSSYKNADGTFKQVYIDILADSIRNGSPVWVSATGKRGGHAVILEDYDAVTNKFYINLGWGGSQDGWYSLENFSTDQYCATYFILDIIPEYDGSVITVTSTDDYGVGTLRRALELANSIKGENIIVIDSSLAGETITLNSTLSISDNVRIIGIDGARVVLKRAFNGSIFSISRTTAAISGFTLDGGGYSSSLVMSASGTELSDLAFRNAASTAYAVSNAAGTRIDASSDLNGYRVSGAALYVPDVVTGLKAVFDASSQLLFSWNQVKDKENGNVSSYKLEYSRNEDFSNAVSLTVSGLSYLLKAVEAGVNYFWRVCGVDSNGNLGIAGDIRRVFTGADTIAPAFPTNLRAEVDDIRAVLSWDAATDSGSGVSHYLVEYALKEDFSGAEVVTVTDPLVSLSALRDNVSYFWRVRAVDHSGNIGTVSRTHSFETTASFMLIGEMLGKAVKTERKVQIGEKGGISLSGSSVTDTYLVPLLLTADESSFYHAGTITVKSGRYGVYGIRAYGTIVDGTLSGTIDLASSYSANGGYGVTAAGIYAPGVNLNDFSGKIKLATTGDIYAYGIYSYSSPLYLKQFAGQIDIAAGSGSAYAFSGGGPVEIEHIEKNAVVSVISQSGYAGGIQHSVSTAASVGVDTFEGSLSITSKQLYSIGINCYAYTDGESASVYIKKLGGSFIVSAETYAFGIRSQSNGDAPAVLKVDELSGTFIVSANSSYAYGIYGQNGVEIGELSGLVIVTSEASYAYALRQDAGKAFCASISGTVISNSSAVNYAVRSSGGVNLSVSGIIYAGKYLEKNSTYAESAGKASELLNKYKTASLSTVSAVTSAGQHYAVSSSGQNDDTVTLESGALVCGKVFLGEGRDVLNISTGSRLLGTISSSENLELNFVLDDFIDDANISTETLSIFRAATTKLSLTLEDIASGSQILIRTSSLYGTWGAAAFTVRDRNGASSVLSVNGGSIEFADCALRLAWEKQSQLVLYSTSNRPPTVPVIDTISTSDLTNQDVVVTVAYDNEAIQKQYSFDGRNWLSYTGRIVVKDNGTLYFRAIGMNNKTSEISTLTIDNIDKIPPERPVVASDRTTLTNQNVTVTAIFSSDTVVPQYSLDGKNWHTYLSPVVFTQNGMVYFRGIDAAGNSSVVVGHQVANIDKVPPEVPRISCSTTQLTMTPVTVSVKFAEDSVRNEFSRDGKSWLLYDRDIVMSNNGTLYFRSTDGAGNLSSNSYTVTNIVESDPRGPVVNVSSRETTRKIITVSAVFDSNSVKQEYSFDNETWQRYNGSVLVTRNSGLIFRSTEASGKTYISYCAIDNILPADPDGPGRIEPSHKLSKYNCTLKWQKAVVSVNNGKISCYEVYLNGQYYTSKSTNFSLKNLELGDYSALIRAIDANGRYGEWCNVKQFTVTDVTPPVVKNFKTQITGYVLNLSWTGVDKKGAIQSYTVKYDGAVLQNLAAGDTSLQLQLTEKDVGKHSVEIIAFDGVNYSKTIKKSITVKDATPPEKVTGLTAPAVQDAKYAAVLEWAPGKDNSGSVSRYEIMLNGKVYKSGKNNLKISKLAIGEHIYRVRAIDKTKNVGEWSDFQTFIVRDVTAPAKVSVKARVEENMLLLTWKTPKDNVGVTGYELRYGENFENSRILEADQLSYAIRDLTGGDCFYELTAFDAAGNRSQAAKGRAVVRWETPESVSALSLNVMTLPGGSSSAFMQLEDELSGCRSRMSAIA